jgi:hypothetical protein
LFSLQIVQQVYVAEAATSKSSDVTLNGGEPGGFFTGNMQRVA